MDVQPGQLLSWNFSWLPKALFFTNRFIQACEDLNGINFRYCNPERRVSPSLARLNEPASTGLTPGKSESESATNAEP
jgi:hypothetical protein